MTIHMVFIQTEGQKRGYRILDCQLPVVLAAHVAPGLIRPATFPVATF